jgi:DNA-binding PadR family transcriptional regulator
MTEKNKNLGEFEILVLAAIFRGKGQSYGTSIKDEIEERTGRDIALGSLYITLKRLEKKGYVKGRMGDATATRGGRAKRYFEIESVGKAQLMQALNGLRAMTDDLSLEPLED